MTKMSQDEPLYNIVVSMFFPARMSMSPCGEASLSDLIISIWPVGSLGFVGLGVRNSGLQDFGCRG